MLLFGTHGKTTCTSMLSYITLEANLDPTILVGGELDAIGGNYRIGKKVNTLLLKLVNIKPHFKSSSLM